MPTNSNNANAHWCLLFMPWHCKWRIDQWTHAHVHAPRRRYHAIMTCKRSCKLMGDKSSVPAAHNMSAGDVVDKARLLREDAAGLTLKLSSSLENSVSVSS